MSEREPVAYVDVKVPLYFADESDALTAETRVHVTRQRKILDDIVNERDAQDALFGVQDLPDGTGRPGDAEECVRLRDLCSSNGLAEDNWRDIFAEEVAETFAESDSAKLRAELVQAVAVGVKWLEAIDRREGR